MILEVYAIKDELTGRFMQPTYMENDAQAIRHFKYNINNIEMWKQNPSDYTLYKIAKFNDCEGIKEIKPIIKITTGTSVVEKE